MNRKELHASRGCRNIVNCKWFGFNLSCIASFPVSRDQIAAMYSVQHPDMKIDEQPSSPAKPQKNSSNKAAKSNKGNSDSSNNKKPEKKPATIEEAVKKVSASELKALLEKVRNRYPDQAVLWIRDAAAYFNVALATESPVPLTSFSDAPLSLLTKETRKTLTALFEQCPDAARQTGFETLLATTAHDMGKGLTANGNLVVLQLMSEIYPSLASHNMARWNELMNSYRNRAPIGTAMLWALGQGGRKDLGVGVNVWLDFMLPVLTMKNYSRFVVEYLSGLLAHHSARVKSGKRIIFPRQLFLFFDALFATAGSLNKELQAELQRQYDALKALSIGDCSDNHEVNNCKEAIFGECCLKYFICRYFPNSSVGCRPFRRTSITRGRDKSSWRRSLSQWQTTLRRSSIGSRCTSRTCRPRRNSSSI